MRRLVTVLVATLAMTSAWSGSAIAQRDTRRVTAARPMLVSLQPGVEITPIISSGDRVGADFQYTGVPDGIGIFPSAPDRLEVFTNHELSYRYGDPAWSRVSHLTLDPQGNVVSASYAVDGTERYEYFCSSTMDMIDGTPWYFTGRNGSRRRGAACPSPSTPGRAGWSQTPQFGSLNHENVVPVHGLDRAVVYLSEDSFRLRSQAYAYFADDFPGAIHGDGSFAVWVPDDQGDGDPSTNDIAKGETLSGHFVTIPHAGRFTGRQLNEKAEALGSFNFVRIEDAATDPGNPGVVYFSDTGANKSETKHGRLYRMTFDPAHPRNATLEVVLDGDAGDDIVNPDNLGIDPHVLLIQEDRNDTASGYNRVLLYDLTSDVLTPIARLDPPPAAIERGAVRACGNRAAWSTPARSSARGRGCSTCRRTTRASCSRASTSGSTRPRGSAGS